MMGTASHRPAKTQRAGTVAAPPRRPPPDAVIFNAYLAELNHGERGAYARAARTCGVSDQHVSNVVRRHTKPLTTPGDDLAYIPAPGQRELENKRLLRQLLEPAVPTAAPTVPGETPTPNVRLLAMPAPVGNFELTPLPGYDPRLNAKREANLMLLGAVVATVATLAVWLCFPVMLCAWHVAHVAQCRYREAQCG